MHYSTSKAYIRRNVIIILTASECSQRKALSRRENSESAKVLQRYYAHHIGVLTGGGVCPICVYNERNILCYDRV